MIGSGTGLHSCGLVSRAEIADRAGYFFFMVADEAEKCDVVFLYLKPSRKWHPHRVTGMIKQKHRKGRYQVIEEPVPPMKRVPFVSVTGVDRTFFKCHEIHGHRPLTKFFGAISFQTRTHTRPLKQN